MPTPKWLQHPACPPQSRGASRCSSAISGGSGCKARLHHPHPGGRLCITQPFQAHLWPAGSLRDLHPPEPPSRDLHPPELAVPDAVPLKSAVHCNLAFYSCLGTAVGPCQERLQPAQNSSFHGGHPGKEQCSRSWDCGNFVFLPLRKWGAAGPARASPSPSLCPLPKIVLGMSFEYSYAYKGSCKWLWTLLLQLGAVISGRASITFPIHVTAVHFPAVELAASGAGFIFLCCCTCRACEQGWAQGTWALLPHTSPRGWLCGAGCWRVTSTPLDGCSVVGSWRVGSGSSSVARPAGSECSSSGRGWRDCGAGSQHCPGTSWCCQLLWLRSNNKCIYWDK